MNATLKEKCAVIGVYASNKHAASYAKQGLAALQHRGQESTGISIFTPQKNIKTYKGMGFVPFVLTDEKIKKLGESTLAIGHNRYGTSGDSSVDTAQPLHGKYRKYELSIGHNGNIPDISMLQNELKNNKSVLSDTSLMAALLAQERSAYSSWEETFSHVLPEFKGAYCLVILTNDGSIYGIRDPYGIRPLVLGKFHGGFIVASESVALDVIGAEFIRDIKPGEIIKISNTGELSSNFFGESKHHKWCIFEYIYFSRPDSFINGRRVRQGREESGRLLGKRLKQKGIAPEVVIPTFDSGYPAAKGVAEVLHLPIVDAITTSHYVGRTFIQPGQENRVKAVNGKHNIIPDEIIGKKVVVVDDSAVRLTTSHILAKGIKDAGALEVTMAFASPPVVEQCDMGIDMRSKGELPASKFANEPFNTIESKVAELIGADNVVYQPIEDTAQAMGGKKEDFYYYPFGGPHPIRSKQHIFPKRKRKTDGPAKLCIFISGTGTNLQVLIDEIEKGALDAEIALVIANKKDAYGVTRAQKHGIPVVVLPFEGKITSSADRQKYEEKLLIQMKKTLPDIILLSGWMYVLGDTFLSNVQKLEIAVINQHPALLSDSNNATILTSRGIMPVIRGVHAIKAAFEKNIQVSGFTVHQVLPLNGFDVGPIILTAEVRRHQADTYESWEKHIRDTEHLFLPTAIKRIIHVVIKNNIDITKGEFQW